MNLAFQKQWDLKISEGGEQKMIEIPKKKLSFRHGTLPICYLKLTHWSVLLGQWIGTSIIQDCVSSSNLGLSISESGHQYQLGLQSQMWVFQSLNWVFGCIIWSTDQWHNNCSR